MTRCIIVGGGLIGMLTARELAAAGLEVTLLERAHTGGESSWAGGGILSPLYPWRYPDAVTVLASWSQAVYPSLAEELARLSGVDAEWTRSGLLVLAAEQEQSEALAWAQRHSQTLELLTPDAVFACAPELSRSGELGVTGGLWLPDVAQVRNPRLVKALRAVLEQNGVAVREQSEVRSVLSARGQAFGVQTGTGELLADAVVIAGGAWSGGLLAGLRLPIAPVRGQMIMYKARPGVVSRIVLRRDRYLIPRRDGRVLVGSTLEHVGFDKGTTEEARAELERFATTLVPALAGFPVERHWAGLRPGSPTGVPWIGPHPDLAGLFLNTGHFRNGVVLGPASARLLADLMLARIPLVDPAPYAPARPDAAPG